MSNCVTLLLKLEYPQRIARCLNHKNQSFKISYLNGYSDLESFMHDHPEQDNADLKSVSKEEETRPFHDGRESIQYSHDISRDFLLSSTRTESSLLRGSLSR